MSNKPHTRRGACAKPNELGVPNAAYVDPPRTYPPRAAWVKLLDTFPEYVERSESFCLYIVKSHAVLRCCALVLVMGSMLITALAQQVTASTNVSVPALVPALENEANRALLTHLSEVARHYSGLSYTCLAGFFTAHGALAWFAISEREKHVNLIKIWCLCVIGAVLGAAFTSAIFRIDSHIVDSQALINKLLGQQSTFQDLSRYEVCSRSFKMAVPVSSTLFWICLGFVFWRQAKAESIPRKTIGGNTVEEDTKTTPAANV